MSLPARIATLVVAFAAVVAGGVFIAVYYIGSGPPVVNYTPVASGGSVNVVLQEDPQNNSSTEPDWVSYFVQDPKTHAWVHTTLFQVPANTRVNMTILGYDGCTPLRNNYWSQIQGTVGNAITVQQFKTVGQPIGPVKKILGPQRLVQLQCRAHVRHPEPARVRPGRLAQHGTVQQQCVQHLAVHCGAALDGEVQLLHAEARRDLPLAVLRAVRRRLPGRQRRPDADARLHDGQHGGVSLMAASQAPAAPDNEKKEPNHGLRIALIWVVLALAADLLIWFVWYPHLPPGRMSSSAASQQFDIAVLALAAAPVMLFVYTYFGYTFVNWRHRDGDDDDGPPIFGHTGLQATWIGGTAVIVLSAFVFGTIQLIVPAGAAPARARCRCGSRPPPTGCGCR